MLKELVATGFWHGDVIHRTREGSTINAQVSRTLLKDDSGKPEGFVTISHDISEIKIAEEALRREKERAERYLQIAGVIISVISSNERVILLNDKGCEVLGWNKAEITGRNWFDTVLPERFRAEFREGYRLVMAGKARLREEFEVPVITRGG
jgi:PAS domain S-box-containing protein